jgi:hypothetical protein
LALALTYFVLPSEFQEVHMSSENSNPRTFVDMVLVLLESRFPWLGTEAESVSGANTIEELADLHHALLEKSTARAGHRKH